MNLLETFRKYTKIFEKNNDQISNTRINPNRINEDIIRDYKLDKLRKLLKSQESGYIRLLPEPLDYSYGNRFYYSEDECLIVPIITWSELGNHLVYDITSWDDEYERVLVAQLVFLLQSKDIKDNICLELYDVLMDGYGNCEKLNAVTPYSIIKLKEKNPKVFDWVIDEIFKKIELKEQIALNESRQTNSSNLGVIVFRGMDKNHNIDQNVWVTDSKEYAQYWANQEYNDNGVVKKFFLPNSVIQDLCNQECFEEIMTEYDAWQEIPDDSIIWENGEDVEYEYDLMHDLCFPSEKQILILKNEGYKGLIFRYDDSCYSILVFNGKELKPYEAKDMKI